MIKMIGNHVCPHCAAALAEIEREHLPIEFRDMSKSTAYIKEFLAIREGHPELFDEKRANNKVGVPVFVLTDGTVTFDREAAFAAARLEKAPVVKVVGSSVCPDCREVTAAVRAEKLPVEFYDMVENMNNMRMFLAIREGNPELYAPVREAGGIGIPVFVLPDGTVTLDTEEGLAAARALKEKEEAGA